MLERISGFTVEQAKDYLMKNLEDELTHEKAVKLMEFEQQTREDAEASAREIISMAIQRCAADHVAEATTVSYTHLDVYKRQPCTVLRAWNSP